MTSKNFRKTRALWERNKTKTTSILRKLRESDCGIGAPWLYRYRSVIKDRMHDCCMTPNDHDHQDQEQQQQVAAVPSLQFSPWWQQMAGGRLKFPHAPVRLQPPWQPHVGGAAFRPSPVSLKGDFKTKREKRRE